MIFVTFFFRSRHYPSFQVISNLRDIFMKLLTRAMAVSYPHSGFTDLVLLYNAIGFVSSTRVPETLKPLGAFGRRGKCKKVAC